MSAGDQAHPGSYSWIAGVYAKNGRGGDEFAGCGVVIDGRRVLTCAHVVGRFYEGNGWAGDEEVQIAFPMTDEGGAGERLPVLGVVFPDSGGREDDVAVLYLAGPLPAGVKAAPLRCPEPASLASDRWQVLGFPDDSIGESASGTVEKLARGWIRLNKESGDRLRLGFSGSGVWSAGYEAVVAVMTQAGGGDGRALTLNQASALLPGENLGDLARWSLAYDREAEGHWEPRARGVSAGSDRRPRFQGRKAALLAIKRWLDRDKASRRVLAVTGAPGAGKSAVLARIVTTAAFGRAREVPAPDGGIRATAGSVGCAVHAKGKTVLEVAAEIARAASAELPQQVEKFPDALRHALEARRISDDGSGPRPDRFNVIIDALDEAASPEQVRKIISEMIMPVAETCADAGAQVIVGLRRTDAEGDLLEAFGGSAELVDLDGEEFFAREDLAAYALATLQLAEREHGGNPYADEVVAGPVADRIAELSDRNFLVAGLTAQAHGLFDTAPVDPAALSFSPEVTSVMREYLRRIPDVAGIPSPTEVLTALAFAEAPGFPTSLWRLALRTLIGDDVPEMKLAWFAKSQAASFLVESSEQDEQDSAFRLFHQALNDALLAAVDPGTARRAEHALTQAFLQVGRDGGWEQASAYLLRSLPVHAARAGLVDDLLADDAYPLYANLRRLLQVADGASSQAAWDRARLLRLTPEAVTVKPAERAALFSVTEALDKLGTTYRDGRWQAPYRARWAAARPRTEHASFEGHQGGVRSVCAVMVDSQNLVATGGDDGTARLWDPRTGQQLTVLDSHRGKVYAVSVVTVSGQDLLATGGGDGTVRVWDPRTGQQVIVLDGHDGWVGAVCAVTVDGQDLLATGGRDGTVRLWDPRTGQQLTVLDSHHGSVNAVCAVTVDGQELLATGGRDGTVRVWDPRTGQQVIVLDSHGGSSVNAVCAVTVDSQELLATGGHDYGVRLWDPRTGQQLATFTHDGHAVNAVCVVTVGGQNLLAAGRSMGPVRVWDPRTGQQLTTFTHRGSSVNALCAVTVGGQSLLATGGGDGTVRVWDPRTGHQPITIDGHLGGVSAVCAVTVGGRDLLATHGGYYGTVELWDAGTGGHLAVLGGHGEWFGAVCAVTVGGRELLATGGPMVRLWDPGTGERVASFGGRDGWDAVCAVTVDGQKLLATSHEGMVRLWDPGAGEQLAVFGGHRGEICAVCAVRVDGRELLASGSRDGTVWLWDPCTGQQLAALEGHSGEVRAVCAVVVDGRDLLAAAGGDGKVRLWDPRTRACVAAIPTHHQVLVLAAVGDSLAIGLSTGILVIEPDVVV